MFLPRKRWPNSHKMCEVNKYVQSKKKINRVSLYEMPSPIFEHLQTKSNNIFVYIPSLFLTQGTVTGFLSWV